ncbi:cobalamin B12-binding domain-containing protein [Lichenifustis flavocetrariae]|uniref:Cobalamin B12-binding domain-containing protein n=1 Tax=Lichenifustis flavocetrariae TaxID=2949735 RepID=A0AA41Z8Z1_9HYPH|nr:cobalamin B12-binding domain-containing protein [Lichenifustis flavocetrariae]MCW6512698.1 cobalamin B12-binding domain-containing protein [Lichenifustis flavocetrariae]
MREESDTGRALGGEIVDGLDAQSFVEAQYRKTELRRRYNDNDAADRVSILIRAIEKEVIPRIVSARVKKNQPARSVPAVAINANCVGLFARILIGHEKGVEPSAFVGDLQASGAAAEAIYLDLLAPAARHLGLLWDDDLCTFLDVTIALGTLHRIMLSLSADLGFEHRKIDPARRVLLVQAPGARHTFGVQMVAEFFRRGAWTVDMVLSPVDDELSCAVQAEWFTVVGFSVACDASLSTLAETIRMVRQASLNPSVGILVGGPAFIDHPDYVASVGADGMAADAIHAVIEAERFVLHTPQFMRSATRKDRADA